MLGNGSRRPWVCARCLHLQLLQSQRRSNSSSSFTKYSPQYHQTRPTLSPSPSSSGHQHQLPITRLKRAASSLFSPTSYHGSTSSDAKHDDNALRQIFDSKSFWKEFSSSNANGLAGKKRAGLLLNKYLDTPEGFDRFSQDALRKCHQLVAKILSAATIEDYRRLVIDLDRLSDQLCRVIDLVEFLRNVHPDARIQTAATRAHSVMFEYMNVLNTTPGLCHQLQKAFDTPEAVGSWREEERVAAEKLLHDFSQSAIDGPEKERHEFVNLSNNISMLGTEITDHMSPEKLSLAFSSSRLRGMDPVRVKNITRLGTSHVPTYGSVASLALRTVEDEDVRKDLYIANRKASAKSVARIEDLVKSRERLAKLSGFASFGHMALSDKMAKTPEAVAQFLKAVAASNKPSVDKDLAQLQSLKASAAIQAWDRSYYTRRARARFDDNTRYHDSLSSFFSLGSVMQGLSRLFSRLFGIRLVPRETAPGETWHEDVRRLDVMDESEGHIAVLYCDLFSRPGKFPNPAHFTLRCSRDIAPPEILESSASLPANPTLADYSNILNDGMALAWHPQDPNTLQQLPTIAFICDFAAPSSSSSSSSSSAPTLLSFSQVSTLFHEMGHALHSMLGRTALQNVAGTRCATDFAELPSILMEHFAASPAVLSLFARHWRTDAPLDPAQLQQHLQQQSRFLSAQETEGQILLSVLDQRFHSALPQPFNSTETYQQVFNDPRFASVAEPAETAWHGFFGHLVGYGAVYYSYLFDRAIAARIWTDTFSAGSGGAGGAGGVGFGGGRSDEAAAAAALDRKQGQKYRDAVLKWGGARDGWRCVADVLGQEKAWMADGGEDAMREVGKWGADAASSDKNVSVSM